ncbi:MAG: hypothetical protein HC780_21715 [Leptolyngbyaceae cyanobacterium CSU_1_3]|nr:hypothetical protein [Leptolyngbyaceae cyanobacterium CSU_1_3]
MQFLSTLRQAIRKSVVILSLAILMVSSSFLTVSQASFADTESPLATEKSFSKVTQNPASRSAAYEEAAEAAKDPEGLEKEYEKEMEVFKEEHPSENPVIEGVKEVVEKVTGGKE